MKKASIVSTIVVLFALQNAIAQPYSHLKLSVTYPEAGKLITVTYDPSGTNLSDKKDIKGMIYYTDNKDYPVSDLDLKKQNGVYKATTKLPVTTKAFFVKLSSDETVDNNNGAGYIYKIYKNGKPVVGAYAAEAHFLTDGTSLYYSKIDKNAVKASELYASELKNHPQDAKLYERYYLPLAIKSKDEKLKADGIKELPALIHSDNEKDLLAGDNILRSLHKTKEADSLESAMNKRFPTGIKMREKAGVAFRNEQDLAKKEEIYQNYVKTFPESTTDKDYNFDGMRQQLMQAYLKAGNMEKATYFENKITDKSWAGAVLNSIAYDQASKGEKLTEDEKLSKRSLDIANEQLMHPVATNYTSLKQAKEYAQSSYDGYADTYAYILAKQGKYAEALKYEQPVYKNLKNADPAINENYAMMLVGAGQYTNAQKVIEESLKAGKSSPGLEEQLKTAYLKINGNSNGYDTYLASLKATMQDKKMAVLMKEMIDKPAPQFALKDFEGKTVSLTDLKGKVVVVDFWATWCGPCKASFPGMQMAVNKYKDDPNVKFLFVDTWENGDDYLPGVKKFIADKNYSFNVLMDEKGEDGRQSKVVSQFKVDGIPTKFVIDQKGNIRFKEVGFLGTDDAVFSSVTSMIEIVKKQQPNSVAKTE